MEISTVSNNTFIQQVGGVIKGKQIENPQPQEDVNVISAEEKSQNIGSGAVRNVEDSGESNNGSGVNSGASTDNGSAKEQEELAQVLDVLI